MEGVEEPDAVEQHRGAFAGAAANERHRGVVGGRGGGGGDRGRPQHVRLQDRGQGPEQHGIDDEGVPGQ